MLRILGSRSTARGRVGRLALTALTAFGVSGFALSGAAWAQSPCYVNDGDETTTITEVDTGETTSVIVGYEDVIVGYVNGDPLYEDPDNPDLITGYEQIPVYESVPIYEDQPVYRPVTPSDCGPKVDVLLPGVVSQVGNSMRNVADEFIQQQFNGSMGLGGALVGPTGKVRHTNHDGLIEKGTGTRFEAFTINEASGFATGSYTLPGTVLGGNLKLTGLVGALNLNQSSTPGAASLFTSAKAEVDALIYGGSYVWSKGSFYSLSMIIGLSGDLDSSFEVGDFSQSINGVITSSVMGNTFDLGRAKFDLRAGWGYSFMEASSLVTDSLGRIKPESSSYNASITGTLFTIETLPSGAIFRPYALASYRHVFEEEITLNASPADDGATFEFEQANDFGRVELGFDIVQGVVTAGAAVYTEFSGDEETYGARLGASIKLD